ncbi:MAG TPA: BON domain-containing protein [Opitutus sp.]|nr:BON domain-containing protein [Opitutus sp.]
MSRSTLLHSPASSAIACFVLAVPAFAAPSPGADLAARVEHRLAQHLYRDAERIHVKNDCGNIVLTGSVEIYAERGKAENIAASVPGVRAVDDRIVPAPHHRPDSVIAHDIRTSLVIELGPAGLGIDVAVDNGIVTLTSAVKTDHQRQRAAALAAEIRGVGGVINHLRVQP